MKYMVKSDRYSDFAWLFFDTIKGRRITSRKCNWLPAFFLLGPLSRPHPPSVTSCPEYHSRAWVMWSGVKSGQ